MNHYLNAIFLVQLEGVNRSMQIRQSASPLWFIKQIRPSILALIPKSGQKYNYTQSPKSVLKK